MTDAKEIFEQVKNSKITPKTSVTPKKENFTRNLVIVGTGDAGCKVATEVKRGIEDVKTLGFNSSRRNESLWNLDTFIHLPAEDGSGKDRLFARQRLEESDATVKLSDAVLLERPDVVCIMHSTGGGTGSGTAANIAIDLYNQCVDNTVDMPVILVTMLPEIHDDPVAIFNTIECQKEINKLTLPYMTFNNNRATGNVVNVHITVNEEIVNAMRVIKGRDFRKSETYSIDNKDIEKVLGTAGRLSIFSSKRRPKVGENIDDYIINMIEDSTQEEPFSPEAYAILIKAPKEILEQIDISLTKIRAKYGESLRRYAHFEESSECEIVFMAAGSAEPETAIKSLRSRYNEIMDVRNNARKVKVDLEIESPLTEKKRTRIGL
jgi:cell division GTPase FtsZ